MRAGLLSLIVVLLAGTGCAPHEPDPAAGAAPPSGQISSRVAHRGARTETGQPLAWPSGPLEVVVSVTDLPPGAALPMHKHPWPRYAYVERGRIEVRYEGGAARQFGPGDVLIEAIDTWHYGQAIGPEPVRIVVIDHVPPGQTNFVPR